MHFLFGGWSVFVNTLTDQREVRPQILVDCGISRVLRLPQRPHAVSVPERVLVAAAPCDWRDANVERAPSPPQRACVCRSARVFPWHGEQLWIGGVCLPPETWQGAEPSRSAVKRRQRRQQRRRRDRNLPPASPTSLWCGGTPEKVCKLPAGAARTPGHLGGGRAGALGASSLPGPKPAAATFCRAAHRRWWARAPGPEGASPSEGTCLSLQAWKARQWRGSPRLHSCSRLLPLSGSRWHRYLFPAAAPNDSSRLRRGCSSQSTAAEPSSPPDSPRNSSKLFTTFLEGQDSRRNQGDVFSQRLHPAFPLP